MGSCTASYHQIMDIAEAVETKLIDPPRIPLRSFTDGVEEMVASIKERGLINPIVVRPVGGRFEVVAGATRFEAVKRLRWTKVPCIVRELRDRDALEVSLAENIQRKSMNPMEEARGFKRYLEAYGRGSETQLARKIGKSQEYVSHRLSLLQLPESVGQLIMRRRINTSIAQEIASLGNSDLQVEISKQVVSQHLTIRGLRKLTRNLRRLPTEPKQQGSDRAEGGIGPDVPDFSDKSARDEIGEEARAIARRRDLQKAILVYKLTMSRLASLISTLPDDSEIKDMLTEQRILIQNIANSLIRLRVKIEKSMGHPYALP